jgi:hypothetical protein
MFLQNAGFTKLEIATKRLKKLALIIVSATQTKQA